MVKKMILILLFGSCLSLLTLVAAPPTDLHNELKKGDILRLTYRFDEALGIFNKLLKKNLDSALRSEVLREITICENGKSMLKFTANPTVISRKTVPLNEFYTRYDVDIPGFWAFTPPALLNAKDINKLSPFVHISGEKPELIYFSSHGKEGNTGWDIYETHLMPNNEWSAPERLSEVINTPFDERFPYLTPDGKTLFFSSNGHYGMGGYNLYKSTKDPVSGTWNTPENLGFPLSSTADDILYVPDADGLYACFASTRNTTADSITLYKIALEGTPVKQSLTDLMDILHLADLNPITNYELRITKDPSPVTRHPSPVTSQSSPDQQYRQLLQESEQVKQGIVSTQEELGDLRNSYTSSDAGRKEALMVKIGEFENRLMQYQSEQQNITKQIQEQEYLLLSQGIVPTAQIKKEEAVPVTVEAGNTTAFEVQPGKMIVLSNLVIQAPIVAVSEDNTQGITYRYVVGSFSKQPDIKIFKNYTPLFTDEVKGKWVYSLGSYTTFAEAQKHAPQFRRDFKNPVLTAYKDGNPIDLKQARLEEGRRPSASKHTTEIVNKDAAYQVLLGEYTIIPPALLKAVQQATTKDISRINLNGKTIYAVGPYTSREEADKVMQVLQHSGFNEVSVEGVERK